MRVLATIVTAAALTTALAQNASSPANPLSLAYDVSQEITFDGKVTGIILSPQANGASPNVTALVKSSNGGASLVILGPQSFVSNQRVKISVKDDVKVTGTKVFLENKRTAVLAASITKNGQTLTLRDAKGNVLWPQAIVTESAGSGTQVGNTNVVGGDIIDLSNAENPRLVVTTPQGDRQIELSPDWYLSNQRSAYSINELLAMNGVFGNIGIPGPVILLPQSGRSGTLFLTPSWRF
jgi:hypothetical protein